MDYASTTDTLSQPSCHNKTLYLDESCYAKMSAFYNYKPVRKDFTSTKAVVLIDSRGVVISREGFHQERFPLANLD